MPRELQRARLAIFVLGLVTVIFTHSTVSFGEDEDQDSLPLMTVSANRFGSAFELITLDVRGENPALVLPFRVAAENPCWSPDSRAIAYRCHKSGEEAVALAEARDLAETAAGDELVAAELRGALHYLGEVAGVVYTDDILDRVFSRFCIGK
jgi:hypothetical protein